MPFPDNLPEREVAEILEREGLVAPSYHPRSFQEELTIWRKRLFLTLPIVGALLFNAVLYSLAPTFYRPENLFYIGTMTAAGAIAGALTAEVAYYFADRDSK